MTIRVEEHPAKWQQSENYFQTTFKPSRYAQPIKSNTSSKLRYNPDEIENLFRFIYEIEDFTCERAFERHVSIAHFNNRALILTVAHVAEIKR